MTGVTTLRRVHAALKLAMLALMLCTACSDSGDPERVPPAGIYRLAGSVPGGTQIWETIELGQYYPDSVRYVLSEPDFVPAADNQQREPVGPGQWGFTFTVLEQRTPGSIRWTIKRDGDRYLCSKLILMSSNDGPFNCTFKLVTPAD